MFAYRVSSYLKLEVNAIRSALNAPADQRTKGKAQWRVGRGGGGPWSPLKIFRGRQNLEKGAKNCITNDARTPFNLGRPKNSSTLLGTCAAASSVDVVLL